MLSPPSPGLLREKLGLLFGSAVRCCEDGTEKKASQVGPMWRGLSRLEVISLSPQTPYSTSKQGQKTHFGKGEDEQHRVGCNLNPENVPDKSLLWVTGDR